MQLIDSAVGMRLEGVLGGANEGSDEDVHRTQRSESTPLILWAAKGHELRLYLAGNENEGEFVLMVITGTGFGMKRAYVENVGGILQTLMDYGVMSRDELSNSLPRAFQKVPVPPVPNESKLTGQMHFPWWTAARTRVAS